MNEPQPNLPYTLDSQQFICSAVATSNKLTSPHHYSTQEFSEIWSIGELHDWSPDWTIILTMAYELIPHETLTMAMVNENPRDWRFGTGKPYCGSPDWFQGQPDNFNGEVDGGNLCAGTWHSDVYNGQYMLNDSPCSAVRQGRFVCEYRCNVYV